MSGFSYEIALGVAGSSCPEHRKVGMSNKPKARKTSNGHAASVESPWPKRFVWIAGVVVVGGLSAIVLFSQPELRGVPEGAQTVAVGDPQHETGDIHAEGEIPTGGARAPLRQNCGFYGEETRS